MKVKIGDKIFDSNEEPIMIIFDTDAERITAGKQISNMEPVEKVRKYVQYPEDKVSVEEIKKFMIL